MSDPKKKVHKKRKVVEPGENEELDKKVVHNIRIRK